MHMPHAYMRALFEQGLALEVRVRVWVGGGGVWVCVWGGESGRAATHLAGLVKGPCAIEQGHSTDQVWVVRRSPAQPHGTAQHATAHRQTGRPAAAISTHCACCKAWRCLRQMMRQQRKRQERTGSALGFAA